MNDLERKIVRFAKEKGFIAVSKSLCSTTGNPLYFLLSSNISIGFGEKEIKIQEEITRLELELCRQGYEPFYIEARPAYPRENFMGQNIWNGFA